MSSPGNPLMPHSLSTFTGEVFHYTSSTGLLGSLNHRSVWASAASSLNDLGEVRQGWELIRTILAAHPASEAVDMLAGFANDPLKRQDEVFVLSASVDGDDAAQWRLYADEGRGYAIGLDGSAALAVVSEVPDPAPSAGKPSIGKLVKDHASVSPWHRVLYQQSDVETAVRELVVAVEAEVSQIVSTSGMPDDDLTVAYEEVQGQAYDALATIAHLIKSPGFVGENEVRVVVTFMMGEEHIRYRAAAHGIVGYAVLAESPGGARWTVMRPVPGMRAVVTSLPVTSVRLGPLLREEQASTMKGFLRSLDLRHVDILTSDVPLR